MKLPPIPLPEPVFMIAVTRGPARSRRVTAAAIRFALWGIPTVVVEYVLATAGHGRHSPWLTMAATYITLAIAVLVVNTRPGTREDPS